MQPAPVNVEIVSADPQVIADLLAQMMVRAGCGTIHFHNDGNGLHAEVVEAAEPTS